jgi:hypothetical protein
VNEVINAAELDNNNWHPHYDCSGHTYIICPYNKEGFEIDTKLHKSHTCNHTYKSWLLGQERQEQEEQLQNQEQKQEQKQDQKQDQEQSQEQSQEQQKSKQKNVIVEEEAEIINAISMILPEDEQHQEEPCKKCHNEITKLKKELEEFQIWRDLILSSIPHQGQSPAAAAPKPESRLKVIKQDTDVEPDVKPKIKLESKPRAKAAKPKIQASKKEIEKGMWCTTCDACNTVAQFATDLKTCCNCKKMTHFNDDLTGCYHWQCSVCSQNSCYSCVKSAGGNKLHPFCSTKCAIIYKSRK